MAWLWLLQVQREGKDITLVGFGKMVGYNLDAAKELEKEGISAEVRLHCLAQKGTREWAAGCFLAEACCLLPCPLCLLHDTRFGAASKQ